jgi:hypothetical protein
LSLSKPWSSDNTVVQWYTMSATPVFRAIPAPSRKELAVGNPTDDYNGYLGEMAKERAHWRGVRQRAFDHAQTGWYDTALFPLEPLEAALAVERQRQIGAPIDERIRLVGLGGLALGRLLGSLVQEGKTEVVDTAVNLKQKPVNMFIELSVDTNNMPNDAAVFMPPQLMKAGAFPEDPPQDGWYQREDGLIVRRTQPVPDPSASFTTFMITHAGNTDLGADAVRLMPYMPAQPGTAA